MTTFHPLVRRLGMLKASGSRTCMDFLPVKRQKCCRRTHRERQSSDLQTQQPTYYLLVAANTHALECERHVVRRCGTPDRKTVAMSPTGQRPSRDTVLL